MAYLEIWDEELKHVTKIKVGFRFCVNDDPKDFEIKLPDAKDGRHQSVMVTLKEFCKSLEEVS